MRSKQKDNPINKKKQKRKKKERFEGMPKRVSETRLAGAIRFGYKEKK